MRLTVEVLPLTADNAHGPYQAQAVAAFKGRKFALPVQLEDTFEQVWAQVEQRYKKNYLNAQQAAAFTIKKLQDAYDCDLDLGDTVSAIFEGETDPLMRMIKVVPTFVNRDFSVPATSNLLPGHAQKRLREVNAEHANKRRRVELQQLDNTQEELDPLRDQPIPTTESERSGEDSAGEAGVHGARDDPQSRRSRTGDSLVLVHGAQTGETEFGPGVKEESPELGLPPATKPLTATRADSTFKKPSIPASKTVPYKSPRVPSRDISKKKAKHAEEGTLDTSPEDVVMQEESAEGRSEIAASPELVSHEAAILRSPRPTSELSQATPPPAATKRRDVYDVPSSPEFLSNRSKQKPKKTYSRSPRTANTVQKEVDLLNSSRFLPAHSQINNAERPAPSSLLNKARAFQLPVSDEIESTPQEAASTSRQDHRAESFDRDIDMTTAFLNNAGQALQDGTHTPERGVLAKSARPGSLKKPSKKTLLATPSSTKRGVQFNDAETPERSTRARADSDSKHSIVSTPSSTDSKGRRRDPAIQARLDKLRSQRSQRRTSSQVVVEQSSPQTSIQSHADSRSAGESPTANKVSESISEPVPQSTETPLTETTSTLAEAPPSENVTYKLLQPPPARTTPMRSPVPLPDNVRGSTPNGSAAASGKSSATNVAAVFKKPDLKLWSTKSNKLGRGNSSERGGSGSSERRSTPLRTEVRLPNNAASSLDPGTEGTLRRLSGSSDASRTSIRTEVPLPSNVRRSSSSGSTQKPSLLNGNSTAAKKPSPTPVSIPPKRRGRPPKNAAATSIKNLGPIPAAKPASKITSADPVPDSTRVNTMVADEAIVISSREPTSSELSDSEEEGLQKPSLEVSKGANNQPEPVLQPAEGHAQLRIVTSKDNETSVLSASPSVQTSSKKAVETAGGQQKELGERKTDNGETTQAKTLNSTVIDTEPPEKETTPWTSQEWGFRGLSQPNGTTDIHTEDARQQAGTPSLSQAVADGTAGDDDLVDQGFRADDRSRSVSAAVSTRSSPAVTRRPARFLSHSPTPEASASESESDESSAAASKAATPPPENDKAEESDSDSDSDSDSSSDSDESDPGIEDTEVQDVAVEQLPVSIARTSANRIPSSPPRLTHLPNSTPLVPETSQVAFSQSDPYTIHKTPVPLPPPSQLRSSQSVSAQAAARRPTARYAGFRTLREQLADTQTTPTATQTRTYDPRTMSLGKLAAKAKSGTVLGADDESSEDESSSSSSSDSD